MSKAQQVYLAILVALLVFGTSAGIVGVTMYSSGSKELGTVVCGLGIVAMFASINNGLASIREELKGNR